ncbi:hypothetical protein H1235_08125 [Pseudoxanthomonas sp. NC8]|nr:hypothetical protein H1235_08125 [Pseudoxanthomonas sp. NC8]
MLRSFAGELGDPAALMPYRSIGFEMDAAVTARILALNPQIYEDIQFDNPHTGEVLERLSRRDRAPARPGRARRRGGTGQVPRAFPPGQPRRLGRCGRRRGQLHVRARRLPARGPDRDAAPERAPAGGPRRFPACAAARVRAA